LRTTGLQYSQVDLTLTSHKGVAQVQNVDQTNALRVTVSDPGRCYIPG